MEVRSVGYSDTSSATTSGSSNTSPTHNAPPPQNWGELAKLISENAYWNDSSSSTPAATHETSTFGLNPKTSYDPNSPADLNSNNGRIAANGVLRLEQFGPGYNPQAEAQIVAQTLGQHKNDPQFLQEYLGTLGSQRTAQIFSYLASPGAVQTPFTGVNGASPQQLKQEYQNVADSLTTLVKNNDFSGNDMQQFVKQFAGTNPQVNFFAKDVLSKASPQVNQMFFEAAAKYAEDNSGTRAGQSMAAYAMQALSQTSNPFSELKDLSGQQLSTLVSAAMKGEAAYGNPPTIDEFAKTGVFRAQNGQGDPLNGLTNLMFDAAYSDVGDQFSPAPLSASDGQRVMSTMFESAVNTLGNDPSVKSFYGQSTSMKDALCVDFQQGYDSILKDYTASNGALTPTGLSGLREFFADGVFSSPPSVYAGGVVSMMRQKLNSYITDANKNLSGKPADWFTGFSLGEQAEAMAAGLQESFASILSGSQQSDQATQNLIGSLLTVGEAAGGAVGPEGAIGAAIVGEALRLVVGGPSPDSSQVQAIADQLKAHGIDVNGYSQGGLTDLENNIRNSNYFQPFDQGLSRAFIDYSSATAN